MSEQATPVGGIRGRIRRRLLVNAVVDPDEAARHLPDGVRPHASEVGTVVGCCLLEMASTRPAHLPAMIGARFQAAAHRISAEWDDELGATTVGVYVPLRHASSRLATMVGGRWFPGVHERASITLTQCGRRLEWSVEPADRCDAFGVRVIASTPSRSSSTFGPVGSTCLSADIGLSPDHHEVLEAVRMCPEHRCARLVDIVHMDSGFLSGFRSAAPAPSFLMEDVDVLWTRERAPQPTRETVSL